LRAATLRKPAPVEDKPLTIEDVPKPVIRPGQVLVEVRACGACRSNLHMIEGDWMKEGVPAKLPIIPGHEITGTIAELSNEVRGFNKGDRVGVQPLWSTCGECEFCFSGREEICLSKQITGETVDGGYAEYLVANASHVYSLPDDLEYVEAAPLFCPGVTAYAAVRKAGLAPGNRVAVFGIGGVGHMVVQLAAMYGAELVAVSRGSQHLELAKELGASTLVDPSGLDSTETLRKIGMVDASIVFAPSSSIAQLAIAATKPGGTIVMGVLADLGQFPFVLEKRIVGSVIGSRQDMREVLSLAKSGRLKALCESYKLEEVNDVLLKLKKGEIRGRAVLVLK
jgi:propanol-preferring alcohol dehydrogenase